MANVNQAPCFVMVTTSHKGVFAGVLKSEHPDHVVLSGVRMCVFWGREMRGVLGLSSKGPGPQCRISFAVQEAKLFNVTGIFTCTPEARKAWEAEPWG